MDKKRITAGIGTKKKIHAIDWLPFEGGQINWHINHLYFRIKAFLTMCWIYLEWKIGFGCEKWGEKSSFLQRAQISHVATLAPSFILMLSATFAWMEIYLQRERKKICLLTKLWADFSLSNQWLDSNWYSSHHSPTQQSFIRLKASLLLKHRLISISASHGDFDAHFPFIPETQKLWAHKKRADFPLRQR